MLKENRDTLMPRHITKEDIIATVSYLFNLDHGVGNIDDIDHLGTGGSALLENSSRTSSVSVSPVWKGWFAKG